MEINLSEALQWRYAVKKFDSKQSSRPETGR